MLCSSSNEPGGTSYRHRLENPKFTFAGKTGSSQVKRFTEAQREAEVKQEVYLIKTEIMHYL